jgi:hypothetical protein
MKSKAKRGGVSKQGAEERYEITGGLRGFHNEDLYYLCSSPEFIRVDQRE